MGKKMELKMLFEIVREGKKIEENSIEEKSGSNLEKNNKNIKSSSDKVDINAK